MHVRSPVRFDGVTVGETDRREYEDDWIQRERERLERRAKRDAEKRRQATAAEPAPRAASRPARRRSPRRASSPKPTSWTSSSSPATTTSPAASSSTATRCCGSSTTRRRCSTTTTTRSARREMLRRRRKADKKNQPSDRGHDKEPSEQDIERKMNKTALVTLWIDPAEHQIVKYTFDNVWMDFLPGGVARARRRYPRLDDDGPAVPRHMAAARDEHPRRRLAGQSAASRRPTPRAFSNYRLADVKSHHQDPERRLGVSRSVQTHDRTDCARANRRIHQRAPTSTVHASSTPVNRRRIATGQKSSTRFAFTATPAMLTTPTSSAWRG